MPSPSMTTSTLSSKEERHAQGEATHARVAFAMLNVAAASRRVTVAVIFEYIEVFYNRRSRHSSLGYRAPAAYEAMRRAGRGAA